MAILVECDNCKEQAPAHWISGTAFGAQSQLAGPEGWSGSTRCRECNSAVTAATKKALEARQPQNQVGAA